MRHFARFTTCLFTNMNEVMCKLRIFIFRSFYFIGSQLCSSNPCQNGGICMSNEVLFVCVCSPGFSGQRCETGEESVLCIQHYALLKINIETPPQHETKWGVNFYVLLATFIVSQWHLVWNVLEILDMLC